MLIILDRLEKSMQAEQGNPAFLPDKHSGLFFPASPRLLLAPCKPNLRALWSQVLVASGFFPPRPPVLGKALPKSEGFRAEASLMPHGMERWHRAGVLLHSSTAWRPPNKCTHHGTYPKTAAFVVLLAWF